MSRVSIITPAYNAAPWIGAAVQSVLDQTHADWELIVINDGSTDATAEVLAGFDDPRITVTHQQNAGVSAARNAGLEAATGEFLTFLDADDLLPEGSLATRVAYLEAHPEVDIVDGVWSFRDADMTHETRRYYPRGDMGPFFGPLARLDGSVFAGIAYMIRRACLGETRFAAAQSHAEDLLFYLTLAHRGAHYGSVSDEVYWVRGQAGSAMGNLAGLEAGYLAVLAALAGPLEAPADDLAQARARVRRILWRSWLRRGAPLRSLSSLWKVARA